MMPTQDDLAGLARTCRAEATKTSHRPTAKALRELARDYEEQAKRAVRG